MARSSDSDFEAFTREVLGVSSDAESGSRGTSPVPIFASPLLSFPSLPIDAQPFDFDFPMAPEPAQAVQAAAAAFEQPQAELQPASVAALAMRREDVLMDPMLPDRSSDLTGAASDPPSSESARSSAPPLHGQVVMQVTAVREKNRIAQRRYRQRQRAQRQETTTRIAELTQQLEALQSKQAELLNREAIFERYLATQRLNTQPQFPPRQLQICGAQAASGGAAGGGGGGCACPEGPGAECDADNCNPCEEFGPSSIWTTAGTLRWAYGKKYATVKNEVLTFTAGGGEPLKMTRDELSRISPAQYGALWKDIVNDCAACLLEASNDMQSPAGLRLLELITEARNVKKTLNNMNPETMAEHGRQMEKLHGPPPADLWRSIAASLTLTPAQHQDCIQLRNAAFTSLGALMRQRSELSRSLTTPFVEFQKGGPSAAASHDCLGSASAAAQLHTMLQEEHSFTALLMMSLFGCIFTPLQTAHCHVLAYPWTLNTLALLDCIAAGHDAPAVADLIQRGASSAERALPPLFRAVPRPHNDVTCS